MAKKKKKTGAKKPGTKKKPAVAKKKQTAKKRSAAKQSTTNSGASGQFQGGRPPATLSASRPQPAPSAQFEDKEAADSSSVDASVFRLVSLADYDDSPSMSFGLPMGGNEAAKDSYLMPGLDRLRDAHLESDDEEEMPDFSVIGADNRQTVTDTSVYPLSAICSLEIFKGGGHQTGTGFLVRANGKSAVVTAGHNIMHNEHLTEGTADCIKVYPGRNGRDGYKHSEEINDVNQMIVSLEWAQNVNPLLDWGMLLLKNDFAADNFGYGHFGMQEWTSDQLTKCQLNVVGYPGSSSTTNPRPYSMWGDAGQICWVGEKTVRYTMDTTGGQSGCPVYAYDGNLATVVGVHNYGRGEYNEATKVTNQIINQIMQFLT